MVDPWLTIVGIGEDGLSGLSDASRSAVSKAQVIFGAPRHLALCDAGDRGREWPVPFSVDPVLALRGQPVVVLASGDPFWHGAGGSLSAHIEPGEWVAHPAPSTFSIAASRLAWRLEETLCIGLHAAPFERLVPILARDARIICLMRDGSAVAELAAWLTSKGFGPSTLTVMEALGGPNERVRTVSADAFDLSDIAHPVAVGLLAGGAAGLSRACGLDDDTFAHDGQITKRPIRALTLSALAPRPGERLWDLGAGSGSVSVEWCLAAPSATSTAVEARADRMLNITQNATDFGLAHRLSAVEGKAIDRLDDLPTPNAVFIGGGASDALLTAVWERIPQGTRLVGNAVTLETEMLFTNWHADKGGSLMRVELAEAEPLGRMRGWARARPVVQWSVTR
ncbi:precorrin-6y C5,15-methyltransferase (decarboxylating) subunit CbiE [Actibacterium lipolyticum]|uniref:Precorrin-6Y C(5,15)-methyltransferase [decarboxylating] n=1 Tax=Actibacterium lipolyticum TaxID=1524263 RepID=A0A238JYR5_9RHOB|nr:precorrin-6y C5,15-methyltransferase (decarboxylating) subunit CbiE [Actibacterium lipolyticum]SMX34846.1 Precorrin-6Y C(5,15)-methyltransferase [decarboxylating] [Actibacterium lipolyticum]